jgi:hypothetical protein
VDRDRLFLETLRDLEARSAGGATEYEVLRSAVLLRQLLLDQSPLLHQVNRDRKIPITFRANIREPIWKIAGSPPPAVWAKQDGLDPETALAVSEVADLDLPAFLSQVIIISGGVELTVRDVIRQVAHVLGGVHAGSEREPVEHALAAVSASLRILGLDPVIRSLEAVGRVVVRALRPLQVEIERGAPPTA